MPACSWRATRWARLDVVRPEAGGEPVARAVGERDRLGLVAERDHREHRAEHLFLRDPARVARRRSGSSGGRRGRPAGRRRCPCSPPRDDLGARRRAPRRPCAPRGRAAAGSRSGPSACPRPSGRPARIVCARGRGARAARRGSPPPRARASRRRRSGPAAAKMPARMPASAASRSASANTMFGALAAELQRRRGQPAARRAPAICAAGRVAAGERDAGHARVVDERARRPRRRPSRH